MKLLTLIPMVSTTQAATFFPDANSPSKRASQILKEMESAGLIQGQRRLDKPKVWRLTKEGRKLQDITKKPLSLAGRKVDHHLAIGDALLELRSHGRLTEFQFEPREKYTAPTGSRKYCPDAYFVYNGRGYLLEVQLSPMASRQWMRKWATAGEAIRKVKWDIQPTKIVVLSKQQKETIGGYSLPLLVVPTIEEFAKWESWARLG